MREVAGRRVLVVGASKGIGRAIASRLAGEGARVAAGARTVDLLDQLSAELNGRIEVIGCDVTDPASCRFIVDTAVECRGGLDALVYATGMGVVSSLANASAQHWSTAFATNVIGANLVTAAAVPSPGC